MPTLYLYQGFNVTLNGQPLSGGSRSAPVSISVDGQKLDETYSLAANTTKAVWGGGGDDALADFDFLSVESDLDGVLVELVIDKGNENGTRVVELELKAGIPFYLGNDGGMANSSANFATGTLDVIDEIRIRNPSGASRAAVVRVFLIT